MKLIRLLFCLVAAYLLAVVVLSFLYLILPPATPLMVADGMRHGGLRREWVPMARISPDMQRAVVVSEDSRFCSHAGIDWHAVDKALGEQHRRKPRGASTITMQVAKNLFLWNGRSWIRKAAEVPLALWIDLVWPKRRILEVYLNIAEWGDGVFGIEAAAKHEFGVSASQLTRQQAAALAIMLPDPARRSARNPGPKQQAMAAALLARMEREGARTGCLK